MVVSEMGLYLTAPCDNYQENIIDECEIQGEFATQKSAETYSSPVMKKNQRTHPSDIADHEVIQGHEWTVRELRSFESLRNENDTPRIPKDVDSHHSTVTAGIFPKNRYPSTLSDNRKMSPAMRTAFNRCIHGATTNSGEMDAFHDDVQDTFEHTE